MDGLDCAGRRVNIKKESASREKGEGADRGHRPYLQMPDQRKQGESRTHASWSRGAGHVWVGLVQVLFVFL